MTFEGGCYCGEVRYESEGKVLPTGQCHCRECQYSTGGSPNMIMPVSKESFVLIKGKLLRHTREDLDDGVTREFCGQCGTHIGIVVPSMPETYMLRAGTLDDPDLFGMPEIALFLCDRRKFHVVPEGVHTFDREPSD